ncbi:hypothetical protein J6590_100527 [Homalodisca vitripennis]|nr:hypothetical protein J6590_100527 [Homalodisca vitripennis]
MAGLVQQRGDMSTRVSGTGRPGGKLLAVTAGRPPPPGSCCVLFAGTHDVAAGETHGILEHLERQITARLSSSAVIVSTVPRHHDLPRNRAVNQEIVLKSFAFDMRELNCWNSIQLEDADLPTTACVCDCPARGCWPILCWEPSVAALSRLLQLPGLCIRLLLLPLLVSVPPPPPCDQDLAVNIATVSGAAKDTPARQLRCGCQER